jgi:hypothetical protein
MIKLKVYFNGELKIVKLHLSTRAQSPTETASFNAEERKANRFIEKAEAELLKNTERQTFVEWAYESNITDHNEKIKLDYQVRKYDGSNFTCDG